MRHPQNEGNVALTAKLQAPIPILTFHVHEIWKLCYRRSSCNGSTSSAHLLTFINGRRSTGTAFAIDLLGTPVIDGWMYLTRYCTSWSEKRKNVESREEQFSDTYTEE